MTYPILDPFAASRTDRPGACALAVMIKAPRPGRSKTRLSPPLTPAEAAGISECFLRDTAANIGAVAGAHPAAGVAVYTPVGLERAFDGLLPAGFSLLAQRGELFGDRLICAAEDLFSLGYGSVCLINSDSPTLPAAALANAVTSLAQPGERAVLGATEDGGYYLIGMKALYRRLLEDIDWSTERVAGQTRQRAAEIGLELVELPVWYDVDDAATLRTLCRDALGGGATIGFPAPRTRAFLESIVAREGRARIWP